MKKTWREKEGSGTIRVIVPKISYKRQDLLRTSGKMIRVPISCQKVLFQKLGLQWEKLYTFRVTGLEVQFPEKSLPRVFKGVQHKDRSQLTPCL